MGFVSKQEDDLDARGESGTSPKGRVSHKKQESPERALGWVCDEKNNWFLLDSLPLNVERMDCYAVYLIGYIDESDVFRTVRVGIKSPEDPLLFILRKDSIIKKYTKQNLYITWAIVKQADLEGVWTYLCEKLRPIGGPCLYGPPPIPVNLPSAKFDNRASRIQQICEERGITTLVHFTRVENLQNILQQGLLGRTLLETRGQQFLFNDPDRVDGHKEAVCLSISFPNYQMFYSIREKKKETQEANDSQWIVLLLDAKVLWELDCAFCQRNAAHNAVLRVPLTDRKRPEALKGMFEDFDNIRHQDLQIPPDYPTDPQAEVLVFDPISTRHIKEIHFYQAIARKGWLSNTQEVDSQTFRSSREYFLGRRDWQFWQKRTS